MQLTQTGVEAVDVGAGAKRTRPFEGGPIAEILRGPAEDRQMAVLNVTVPPGCGMPNHAHGSSEVVLIVRDGNLRLTPVGEDPIELSPGRVAVIPVGDVVALENPTDRDAAALVVLSPPEFAEEAASWPSAEG